MGLIQPGGTETTALARCFSDMPSQEDIVCRCANQNIAHATIYVGPDHLNNIVFNIV